MALACLSGTLIGCSATLDKRASEAAIVKAIASAPTNIADWPAYCDEQTPKVIPKINEKWRWVQYRWEVVAENEDKRKAWCAEFYKAQQNHAASQ